MNAQSLHENLTARGVCLWVDRESLKIEAPSGVLTDSDRAAIREHKAELIEQLSTRKFTALSETARQLINYAASVLRSRLERNECPSCGYALDLSQREPLWMWDAECRRFWSGAELNELRDYVQRRSEKDAYSKGTENTYRRAA
jgi:hypothetical protein